MCKTITEYLNLLLVNKKILSSTTLKEKRLSGLLCLSPHLSTSAHQYTHIHSAFCRVTSNIR